MSDTIKSIEDIDRLLKEEKLNISMIDHLLDDFFERHSRSGMAGIFPDWPAHDAIGSHSQYGHIYSLSKDAYEHLKQKLENKK